MNRHRHHRGFNPNDRRRRNTRRPTKREREARRAYGRRFRRRKRIDALLASGLIVPKVSPLSDEQIGAMRRLLRDVLRKGAIGHTEKVNEYMRENGIICMRPKDIHYGAKMDAIFYLTRSIGWNWMGLRFVVATDEGGIAELRALRLSDEL